MLRCCNALNCKMYNMYLYIKMLSFLSVCTEVWLLNNRRFSGASANVLTDPNVTSQYFHFMRLYNTCNIRGAQCGACNVSKCFYSFLCFCWLVLHFLLRDTNMNETSFHKNYRSFVNKRLFSPLYKIFRVVIK